MAQNARSKERSHPGSFFFGSFFWRFEREKKERTLILRSFARQKGRNAEKTTTRSATFRLRFPWLPFDYAQGAGSGQAGQAGQARRRRPTN